MEEVDNIIIHTLREIGCDLAEEVVSLKEFTPEMVVHAVAHCLSKVDEEINVPSSLPQSMSARFRIGATLASTCKDLGYKGEIGYQTFLYANELEIRNVMMFLIEKLPKESTDTLDEATGTNVLLNRRIADELKRQLSSHWMPPYCRRRNLVKVESDVFLQGKSSFHHINTCYLQYPIKLDGTESSEKMLFVCNQPEDIRDLHSSLIEENAYHVAKDLEWENEWSRAGMASRLSVDEYRKQKRDRLLKRIRDRLQIEPITLDQPTTGSGGLKELLDSMGGNENKRCGKGSRFTHTEKLVFAVDDEKIEEKIVQDQQKQEEKAEGESEEEVQEKRDGEIHILRDELNELTLKLQNCQTEIKQLTRQKENIDETMQQVSDSTKELESAYKVKKKTVDLLPDAEYNIAKLEELIQGSHKKMENLKDQWEKHRVPLVEKHEELKEQCVSKTSQVEMYADQVRTLKEKMKNATDDLKAKEEVHKQLTVEFEALTIDRPRSAYTKRILEIVGNIKKQKDQIATVLKDTKSLQKDINFLTGKLDRTFIVTDELIFRDAKKDEFSKKAYKLLAGLHENFGSLVGTIESTGSIMREIRDLEEQIDNISEKEINDNIQRIGEDLKQIQGENNEMMGKIKSKR